MVLIDSSVWIRFYDPKGADTPEFDGVLSLGQAATTDLIITEVMQGFKLAEKRRYRVALGDLESCIEFCATNGWPGVAEFNLRQGLWECACQTDGRGRCISHSEQIIDVSEQGCDSVCTRTGWPELASESYDNVGERLSCRCTDPDWETRCQRG